MDVDIGVAEQLQKEARQCLASLARKMQLHQSEHDLLQKRKTRAEEEERELLQCIKDLKDMQLVYNRETNDAHTRLAEKSAQFQELTTQASEGLSVKALQLETAQLRSLIEELEAEERLLLEAAGPVPAVDEQAVAALLAESRSLQRAFQEAAVEHGKVCAAVRTAMAAAGADRGPAHLEETEQAYCRLLEEGMENMTLLPVEMDSSADEPDSSQETASGTTATAAGMQSALNRLALLRDELDAQLGQLAASLGAPVASNRQLAEELGLLQEGGARQHRDDDGVAALYLAPDSTTPESPGERAAEVGPRKSPLGRRLLRGPRGRGKAAMPRGRREVAALSAEQRRKKTTIHVEQIVLDSGIGGREATSLGQEWEIGIPGKCRTEREGLLSVTLLGNSDNFPFYFVF